MQHGWIKLWRNTLESAVFADAELLRLWVVCLLLANHKDSWVSVGGLAQPVKVLRGQFLTGRHSLHRAIYPRKTKKNLSESALWRKLNALETLGNLTIKTNNKFSVVTITNYAAYNDTENESEQQNGQQDGQQANSRRAADAQQVNTNKNDKNVKNDKNEEKKESAAVPQGLLGLIDGWQNLGPTIVLPGNGVGNRLAPAKALLAAWNRTERDRELRAAVSDVPALMSAIRKAKFCHRQGWFTPAWLFGKNKNGELNSERLLAGAHDGNDGRTTHSTRVQRHDPSRPLGDL